MWLLIAFCSVWVLGMLAVVRLVRINHPPRLARMAVQLGADEVVSGV